MPRGFEMSLEMGKYCVESVNGSDQECRYCGAALKSRGVISLLVKLIIIVFFLIPLCMGVFLAVCGCDL
jgi:hypothetical protein